MDETLSVEDREFREINAILPSLLKEDLITDIECRIIVGCKELVEKQAAVYKVMMSKTKEDGEVLFESFRTLTVTIYAGELSKMRKTCDCKDERENNLPLDKPNPLLNSIVVASLFGYLRFDDIKDARLVCREWNSAAEICLRNRSTIHFRHGGLRPLVFMAMSKYSLPDLPFSAYEFSDVGYNIWWLDEIELFVDKWGKNIKKVKFDEINLYTDPHTVLRGCLPFYNVTPWIAKMSNLCCLEMKNSSEDKPISASTVLHISIDKLASIKTVVLENCRILTNGECVSFLPFSTVSLCDVSFQRMGNVEILQDFCYNDVFDFSQTKNLALSNQEEEKVKFDMEGQIFNQCSLFLNCVTLKNWVKAKGDVNVLRLSGCNFTERNQLKIQNLLLDNLEVDLSVLPQTLETISFGENVNIVCQESFQLPHLKHLLWKVENEYSGVLTHNFANCPNLTELQLFGKAQEIIDLTIDLDCIPRSVKILRINGDMRFEFTNSDQILELDILFLESFNDFSNCRKILERIKPKVLGISYYKFQTPLDPSEIVGIVLDNKHTSEIAVGADKEDVDLHENFPFEGSTLSSYVDKKSNYYVFENQVGEAIEREEFEDIRMVSEIERDAYGLLRTLLIS